MILLQVTWFVMLVHVTCGDYTCVCSFNVETTVYSDMSGHGTALGSIYEFECKTATGTQIGQWIPIAFEHKAAYLQKDSQTVLQTCQGEIPFGDRFTVPTTTMSTSTRQSTPITTKTTSSSTSTTTTTTTNTTPSNTTTSTTPSTTTTSTTPSTTTTSTTPSTTSTSTTPSTTTTSTTPSTTKTSTTPSITTTTSTPSATTRSTTTTSKSTPITTAKTTAPTSTSSYHYEMCPDNILLHAERHNDHTFMYNHLCYEIVPNEKTWRNAETDCSTRGGHLADIRNASEQTAIYNHLKFFYHDAVWIGLQDHDHEEHFNWTTGAALSYTHWATNRKDRFDHNIEDCVIIQQHGGRWDDVECYEVYGYVCQFGVSPTDNFSPLPPLQTTPLSPLSPLDSDGNTNLCTQNVQNLVHHYHTVLTQYGDSCYHLMHNKVTWEHGEDLCIIQGGGHLVQVNNANEQEYLAAMLKRHNNGGVPVWIGLHDMYNEGEFMWSDDTDVTYTHWMHGSYNNYLGHRQEDCVVIKPSHNYRWDDMPCDDTELHYALCEYDTVQSSGPIIVGR